MKKITRKQRLDLSENGFYKCGYMKIENLEMLESALSRLEDELTEELERKVRETNTKLSIAKIRSKDFIDNEGCYYDYKGETYQHGEFLMHVYPYRDGRGQASITLIA